MANPEKVDMQKEYEMLGRQLITSTDARKKELMQEFCLRFNIPYVHSDGVARPVAPIIQRGQNG